MPKAQDDDLVMNLVELALSQPLDSREAYLLRACEGNGELFGQVWDYVQWNHRMQNFLLEPLFPALREHQFEPGDLLADRFRIVREVAQGGMGIVYEAEDERLGRRIALKCAKSGFRKQLPPEVRHASEISHPNVCKIFEIHTASTAGGQIDFLTMEFLEGDTLAARLSHGPLPESEAREIARQLCAGLAEAHRNHVVHGDLKSNNVILAPETGGADAATGETSGGVRAVITDFGLARKPIKSAGDDGGSWAASASASSRAGGTPDYMAPELWKGEKPSAASDVYALGVILYELAAGRRPYGRDLPWQDRLELRPPPVHHGWDSILQRCLDPDPAKRFQDGAEVAAALEPSRSRRWWMAAAAAVALAAVSGLVTYQRTAVSPEVVRLAILPFETDAGTAPLTEGLLLDTANRLRHLKGGLTRRLTVIPLSDAIQNKVDQTGKARTMLGATHVLHGMLRQEAGRNLVVAYLTDTVSSVHLKEWRADYETGELRNMPVALAGMVTATLNLPPMALAATVNAKAYPDYLAGVSLLERSETYVDRALPLLERAIHSDPDSPLLYAKLAEAQWSKATAKVCKQCVAPLDPDWAQRALASLKNAEQRNPDVAEVRLASGMIHDYYGQHEQALEDFQRAIELEPNNADAWRRIAKVYEGNNRPSQALTAYLKAVEVQPGYFRSYEDLGTFYFSRGEYEDAVRQYKEAVRLVPDLASSHYALATAYSNMGRYSDTEYEFNIALSFQETANAVEGLGVVRMYQGQDREATPYFQRAIDIGPVTSLYYVNLGTSLRRANLPRESSQVYRKGLELAEAELARNPLNGYGRACLAYLCARLGDRKRAASEVEQALEISHNAINVRWMAVLTYEALGARDRALALIQDAPATLLDRLKRFPDVAELSADSRFQKLMKSDPAVRQQSETR